MNINAETQRSTTVNRLANPVDSIEVPTFELFKEMCGQYEWTADTWRAKARKVLEALIDYDSDFHKQVHAEMVEMYAENLEDARLGRGAAEVENCMRDSKAMRSLP